MSVKISFPNKSRKEKLEAIMALTGKDMYAAMSDVLDTMRRISHDDIILQPFLYYLRSGKLYISKKRTNYLLKLAASHEDGYRFYAKLRTDEFIDLLMLYITEQLLEQDHNVSMSHFYEWENTWDDE